MTPFWLWVAIGCQLSAALGFSAVRYGVPGVRAVAGRRLERPAGSGEAPAVVAASTAPVRERAEHRPPTRPAGHAAKRGYAGAGKAQGSPGGEARSRPDRRAARRGEACALGPAGEGRRADVLARDGRLPGHLGSPLQAWASELARASRSARAAPPGAAAPPAPVSLRGLGA